MTKEQKSQDWVKVLLFVILLVLCWNSWQILEMGSVAERVDKYNRGVIDEMGKVTGDVKLFSEDLNEIRRFLLLPEKKYFGGEPSETPGGTEEKASTENSQAVFSLLDSLVKEDAAVKSKVQAQTAFDALLANADFQTKIAATQLKFGERAELQIRFTDAQKTFGETQENVLFEQPLYTLVFSSQDNAFKVQSALGDEVFKEYTAPDFSTRLADYLTKNISAARDKKIAEKKTAAEESEKMKHDAEAQLTAWKKELEDIVKDKAFTETLASIGLKVAEKPREENNKYIFDVMDGTGRVKLSLALEISSGMMKVIRDNQETDIKTFLESAGSKKKP